MAKNTRNRKRGGKKASGEVGHVLQQGSRAGKSCTKKYIPREGEKRKVKILNNVKNNPR